MNTSKTGSQAEQSAAEHLVHEGFEIVERNFKTPRCEIDIIARKSNCLYFVEVKYRSGIGQGGGLDYVTNTKLRHMHRAAEIWLQTHRWTGTVTLSAIEVRANFEVGNFIESIAESM